MGARENEPVAVGRSQVLLEENGDPARHAAVNADLRDPDRLWERVFETGVINMEQPGYLSITRGDPRTVRELRTWCRRAWDGRRTGTPRNGPNSPVIEFDQPNEAAIWAGVGRKP